MTVPPPGANLPLSCRRDSPDGDPDGDDVRDGTVLDRFDAAALRWADQVALRTDTRAVSYAELADRVADTAAALRTHGVGGGDLVALCADRSAESVIALLAVLTTGAGAAPVAADHAAARAAETIAALRPALTLADHAMTGCDPLPLTVPRATRPASDQPRSTRPTAADLAYVLHTSGSTGRPRPVFVPHGALANRIAWAQATYPLGPGDAVLHAGSLIYDFSFWDVLAPLCCGATVVVAPAGAEAEPAALAELMVRQRVTAAHFIPTLLAEFLAGAGAAALRGLRLVFSGGEALPPELARRLRAATPARVFNQYGPTEACIDVLAGELREADLAEGVVPVGRPIAGISAQLLDATGRPVPVGEPGELCVGGAGLAWGYGGLGAATAAVFVPDPTGREPGARLYRTGDRMRQRPDGGFEFLGRLDRQVKIRGVRVEPGDVENALLAYPGVRQAAVVADERGRSSLVAHLVGASGPVEIAALRRFLADRLPPAAVPGHVHQHASLPKLASGKVDHAALTALSALSGPDVTPAPADPTAAEEPMTPTQARLAAIWSEVLGVEGLGRSADFFQLGGQSLLVLRLIARVRQQFGVRISARALFDAPTPESFGALLDSAGKRQIG